MKKLTALLFVISLAFSLNAQYVYNDYDDNQNETFNGWENMPVAVANPDQTGINTSPTVAQWDRTTQQWSNIWADLSGTVDFTTGTVFSIKVWSPVACDVLFKLEDGGGGATERLLSIATPSQWVQLDFDFSGEPSGVFNKVVFFLDFASTNPNTFYFDDIQGPHHSGSLSKPLLPANVQDNFENNGWGTINSWLFQDPGLDPLPTIADPANSSNTVADYNRSGSFEWTNAQAELDHRMDLSVRNVFEIKVYFPSSNDYSGTLASTVALKLQNSLLGGNAWTTQAEIIQTVTDYDQWVTLTFDYSGWSDVEDYDKLIVQFGGEGHWAPGQFYFDDLKLLAVTPPYIYNDFDTDQNVGFEGWPNFPTIVSNPDPTGINTSPNVAEWVRSEEQYAHVYALLEGPVNFTDATNFTIKVHSPVVCPVLLKLENQNNPGLYVQATSTIGVTDEWTLLNFDFTGANNDIYDKIVIFFDFESTSDHTFYFDDIMGPEFDGPKPLLELDLQDNFEDDGWSTIDYWSLQDPDLNTLETTADPEDAANNVADYVRSGSFQWTNAQTILEHRMDLSERNKFEIDVYFPSSNDYSGPLTPTASMKLQNSLMGANAWMTQTEVVHTITTYDTWQTILFDFSAVADSINYDQIVVQLGGEGHWVPAQFYFDNFYLKHVPEINVLSPNGDEEIEQGASFEIEWDYNYWDGDIKIELQKGQQSPQLIVLNIPASDSSFTWNVIPMQEPGDDYRIIITSLADDFPSDTSDAYFSILEATSPQAGFTADITLLAVGDSVMFTDMSSGDPTSWEWTFEGGTPDTYSGQTPPYILYEMAGKYDVTLEISNGVSTDILTIEDYITVGEVPVSDFEAEPTQLIAGEQVDFTNLSSGEALSFEWFFEGGTPETSTEENPAGIVYSTPGIYDVSLIVVNQFGSDTLVKDDYIDVMPVGLNEYDLNNFKLYPNPATDIISLLMETSGEYNVRISSMGGNILGNYNFSGQKFVIDVNDFNTGIYIVILRNEQTHEEFVRKIIIAK